MSARSMAALLIVVAAGRVAGAVDVTECGEVIEAGDIAELRNDLSCARPAVWPFIARGVSLPAGSTLHLNGFTISGDGSGEGVLCHGSRRCTIEGPGEIRGFELGVSCGGCRVVARDVVFRGNTNGILIPKSGVLDAERVVASDNSDFGIWAHRLRARDVETSRNGGAGLVANMGLRARGVTASDNGREGIRCQAFECGRSRIVNATVAGNDSLGAGYDIASSGPVRLRDVSCGRSARLYYPNWRDGDETVEVVGSFGCAND